MKPKTVNIIGDIAGRFDELMELLAKMPAADLVLSVGDMIDRGSQSREVVEWFMADPIGRDAVHANHENMALDAHFNHDNMPGRHPYWFMNGGDTCIDSYGGMCIPEDQLKWLASRPMWYKTFDGLFVSHAPVYDVTRIAKEHEDWRKFRDDESSWCWNRHISRKPMPGYFMVYGHNSHFVEHHLPLINSEGNIKNPHFHYATCIDNSRHRELMGMHWPTKELYKVDYHQPKAKPPKTRITRGSKALW